MMEDKVIFERSTIKGLADAIRLKRGITNELLGSQFEAEVLSIETSENLDEERAEHEAIVAELEAEIESLDDYENPYAELNYKIYSTQSASVPYDIPKEYFGGVTALATNAFYHKYGLRSVDISEMTSIGSNAFYQCSSLIEIIGTKAKTIASQICNNCTSLRKASFPEFAGTVPTMFNNCTALEEVDFPKATSYGANCFKGLTALKRLVVPATVKTIGANSLNCGSEENKTTFIFEGTTPPTIQSSTFIAENIEKIIVPIGCGDVYRNATNWTTFADYIEEAEE